MIPSAAVTAPSPKLIGYEYDGDVLVLNAGNFHEIISGYPDKTFLVEFYAPW